MDTFKHYTPQYILNLIILRDGETKAGEKVTVVSSLDALVSCAAKYVLVGIPESIGVKANYGIGGAETTWEPALKAILNTQSNTFFSGEELIIAGYFDISAPADGSIQGLRNKVNEIDALVYPVIQKITELGKVPIVIGGGHNNASPIISGVSIALNKKINTINIDAHADLRKLSEGRHSGNGFSAAFQHGYLDHYYVFGLHKSYNNQDILDMITVDQNISAVFFDDLLSENADISAAWKHLVKDIVKPCGLEIDLDSVGNVLSSAITPSGFHLNEIRKMILNTDKELFYLHVCEGAIQLETGETNKSLAKAIAYLVCDFIRAQELLK